MRVIAVHGPEEIRAIRINNYSAENAAPLREVASRFKNRIFCKHAQGELTLLLGNFPNAEADAAQHGFQVWPWESDSHE